MLLLEGDFVEFFCDFFFSSLYFQEGLGQISVIFINVTEQPLLLVRIHVTFQILQYHVVIKVIISIVR